MTTFPDDRDAVTALSLGVLCSSYCQGHTILYRSAAGELCVVCFDPPLPTLDELYPRHRRRGSPSPESWPTPSILNRPLRKPRATSPIPERCERALAYQAARTV